MPLSDPGTGPMSGHICPHGKRLSPGVSAGTRLRMQPELRPPESVIIREYAFRISYRKDRHRLFFRKMLKSGSVYVIRAETGSESGQQCSDFRPLPDKDLSEKS